MFSGKDCVATESALCIFLLLYIIINLSFFYLFYFYHYNAFFFFLYLFLYMQAKALLKLHHSNICAYKELFVTWDHEVRMK